MDRIRMFRIAVALLACLGMILPAPILHAAVAGTVPKTHVATQDSAGADVVLHPGGVLFGQVVDSAGTPRVGIRVSLRQLDREVAAAVTDQSGRFFAKGLRGGSYEIVAGQAGKACRVWAPNTAPPTAGPGVLIVAGRKPVRGQEGPIGYWLCNPWVLAGLVAAAVAIPVAIHNHRADRSSSP